MSISYKIIIPARYKSSRFPGKPLLDLNGKSMIQRTYDQCIKVVDKDLVYVATEDERIMKHCMEHNMNAILTSDECLTGTDRIAEVATKLKADYYINVQGDEPLFNPDDIKKIIELLPKYNGEILNGYCSIDEEDLYRSLSIPKVVFTPDKRLLYMSRTNIPSNKSGIFEQAWRQVCIYAFPSEILQKFTSVKEKTPLEQIEDIEILRFLELGCMVRMVELSKDSIAIDNPEDVEKVLIKLKEIDNL